MLSLLDQARGWLAIGGLLLLAVFLWSRVLLRSRPLRRDRATSAFLAIIYTGFLMYFFSTAKWVGW